MANETAEPTAAHSAEAANLFGQACGAFGESLKVVMKAQEDTIKFWGQAIGKARPMQCVAGEFLPIAEKNAGEYLRLPESSYRRNAELLKKVMHPHTNGDGANLEKQTREWWEASREAARDNVQDLASTNLRVAQMWAEMFKMGASKVAVGN